MKQILLSCVSICALISHVIAVEAPTKRADSAQNPQKASPYLVIDLAKGANAPSYPVSNLSAIPVGGWAILYKTDKLVLRRIEAGSFMMGSPDDEFGRYSNEDLHHVTLTKPYYIGVFEVTQRQWELVMEKRSSYTKGDARPVDKVSYDMIRGTEKGTQWPAHAEVDHASFIGQLRAKTSLDFDLPTEAQWEYACRVGTKTALNSGKNMTKVFNCRNIAQIGVSSYKLNQPFSRAIAGSRSPNGWGLYDMHGNAWEWCLDTYTESLGTASVIDPVGATSGARRLSRGGSGFGDARLWRSAARDYHDASSVNLLSGLRVVVRIK